jgi:ATP-binding cassette subfamily B protein
MLSSMLDVPLRKDSVRKILEENINKKTNEIGLDLCAAIAESIGLKTQIARIPKNVFQRSLTPLFFKDKNKKIYICFDVNNEFAIIGDPNDEIKELPIEEFYKFFSEEGLLEVVIFTKTSRTPSKKFGLSWFKPAIKKHRKALTEVLIASIFVQVFQLMNPLIIQQIIDKVIGQNGINTLPVLAVLLFTFSIFENVLTAVRTNLFIDTTNRIDLSLGEEIIDHLLRLPLTYFDKRPVGELSSRLAEMEQIRSFLTGTALTVLLDAIFSFLYIGIMLIYSWVLTIVALLVAPVLASITFLVSPVIRRQLRRKAELNANTQNHLVEILTGIQTVKAQNIELNSRWRWRNRYTKYISEGYKNAITSTTSNSLSQFLNQASSLAVLCVGTFLVLKGQLTLGELIAFRIISGYVTTPLLRLANLYQGFQQTAISIERIGDILNNVQESTKEDKLNIPLPPIEGKVSYEDLSFRFNKKGPLQLSQVSLEIKQGEFVAIVGQSGSGKSTLMKLLSRLYDPDAGKISIDGYDISKVELYSLRRQIGIVPQDSLLFDGSVEDNISLSMKDASSDEIVQAAKVACAHDFIMTLPVGYASKVGERGTNLSGGQRQRIAIARTVLQNPKLLVMDEATSALDYETERKVSLNLMEFFRGTTVFFITHRLTSITHADRIVMMHNGKIEEQGTHEELISLKGRYFALFNQQKYSSDGN